MTFYCRQYILALDMGKMTVQTFPKALSTRRLLSRYVLSQVSVWSVHWAPQLDWTTQSTSTVWIICAQRAPACRNVQWMTEHKNNTCSLQPAPLSCAPGCRSPYPREHTKSVNQHQYFLPVQTGKHIETTGHCALGSVNNPLKESSVCKGTREVTMLTMLCGRGMTHWPMPKDTGVLPATLQLKQLLNIFIPKVVSQYHQAT